MTALRREQVAAAALVCHPGATPARVRDALACGPGTPAARGGLVPGRLSLDRLAAVLEQRGTHVYVDGADGYPIADAIPDRPAVLLAEGDVPAVLRRPRVAVVGTRSATPHGLRDAHDLGAFLAREGITVVSGLAIGVDGAVHEGALDAAGGVVGVVATGLDVVYPRRHASLFDRVRRGGLIVSESGFGVRPTRGRFPVRNRIIAALGDVVVVVEATLTGGARITAEHALEYGRTVLAVPGSRRNPAAAGCNALLADGAHPLLEPDDVIVALGLSPGGRRGWGDPAPRPHPAGDAAAVLRACGGEAATADQLASRSGLPPALVAKALRALARDHWVERGQGHWWPR